MTELEPVCQNWVMVISEQHRYQGVSYKSDIIVISGLDPGDRQVSLVSVQEKSQGVKFSLQRH